MVNLRSLYTALTNLDTSDCYADALLATNALIEAKMRPIARPGADVRMALKSPGKCVERYAKGRHGTYWAPDVCRSIDSAMAFAANYGGDDDVLDILTAAVDGVMPDLETSDPRDLPRAIVLATLDFITDDDGNLTREPGS